MVLGRKQYVRNMWNETHYLALSLFHAHNNCDKKLHARLCINPIKSNFLQSLIILRNNIPFSRNSMNFAEVNKNDLLLKHSSHKLIGCRL